MVSFKLFMPILGVLAALGLYSFILVQGVSPPLIVAMALLLTLGLFWRVIGAHGINRRFNGRHVLGLIGSFALTLMASSGVLAATCPPIAQPYVCPANSVCLRWDAVTTLQGGTALAPGELANYEIALDGVLLPLVASTATSATYTVPLNKSVQAGAVWRILAIDGGGLRGEPVSCTQSVAVVGPKSPPAAVSGFSVGS